VSPNSEPGLSGAVSGTVIGTPGERRLTAALRRLPAWIGLLVVIGLVVVTSSRPVTSGVRDLGGAWHAEVHADGDRFERIVELPGLYSLAGIPWDARVIASRDVTVGAEPLALFVDRPQYAVTATWDGRAIGGVGDPAASGADARSTRSLFALLPPSEPGSTHQLGLDLRGDLGKGGVLGTILIGPVADVHTASLVTEVQRVALSLGLALLAALPLAVAARGAWRPAYVAYGLFATALSVQSAAQSNLVAEMLADALVVTRVLRTITPVIGPLTVIFAARFVRGRLEPVDRGIGALGAGLSVLGVLAPPWGLYTLELVGEGVFVVSAARFAHLAAIGVRSRAPGSMLLAVAVGPVFVALVSEITLTHGLRSGGSYAATAGLLFAAALGAALVIRDAEHGEQHERLVRGSIDAMVTVAPGGRISDANPAARRLLGPLVQEVGLLQVVKKDDRIAVQAHLSRALQRADRTEFRTLEDRVLESLATPLGPDLITLTLRDITIRRELDQGLLHAARMETVGVLLGGIAHDFNNMLSTLLAHLGLLRTQVSDARARERIDRMESAVDRASELTRRLLTVARGTGSELVSVDLAEVVAGAVELVEPTLPPGVKLRTTLPTQMSPVLGAAGDLEQVIVNLLVNARDAVGATGTIRIAARPFRHGERGLGTALMVEDDGPGVVEGRKDDVFQPFVTDKQRGTGLGLAVSRQILRDHHGRIWVEDRPGGGARFLVALRHAGAAEAPAPLPDRRRIVLVEDEVVLLEDYERALTDAGYEVSAFPNGAEAAVWLPNHDLDLLVTDLVMPGMNGLDLARVCLERHPHTPVLFVSAFIPHESLRALPDGTWHALHKPVRAERLVSTVGRLRRRAERKAGGDDEITWVNYLFPDLADLTAAHLGFDTGDDDVRAALT
jgi:signal transduction histidine kinase/CheY-like chemotaxis protein